MSIGVEKDPLEREVSCKACRRLVTGRIGHLGFSDLVCMYCSGCPNALLIHIADPAILSVEHLKNQSFQHFDRHLIPFWNAVAERFRKCECGVICFTRQ